MTKTYNLFKRLLNIILIGIFLTTVLSVVTFSVSFDKEAKTLDMDAPLPIILMALTAVLLIIIAFLSVKMRKVQLEKIEKDTKLNYISSLFAAVMAFGAFVSDIVSKVKSEADHGAIAYLQMLLTLVTCAYFVIEALPLFTKRKAAVHELVLRALCVGAILWAILGLFTIYFDTTGSILTSSIIYDGKILAYVTAAMFFVFEAERAHSKVNYGMYILSALLTALISFTICAGLVFCFVFGTLDAAELGFGVLDYSFSVGIGLFAVSRIYAVLDAMKTSAIDTEKNNG